jgi:hypothetical protein
VNITQDQCDHLFAHRMLGCDMVVTEPRPVYETLIAQDSEMSPTGRMICLGYSSQILYGHIVSMWMLNI